MPVSATASLPMSVTASVPMSVAVSVTSGSGDHQGRRASENKDEWLPCELHTVKRARLVQITPTEMRRPALIPTTGPPVNRSVQSRSLRTHLIDDSLLSGKCAIHLHEGTQQWEYRHNMKPSLTYNVIQRERAGDVTHRERAGDVTHRERAGDATHRERAGDIGSVAEVLRSHIKQRQVTIRQLTIVGCSGVAIVEH